MTKISKCLTVFALVASLAFLGAVSVSSMGGPNFEAHKNDPALSGIVFTEDVNEETGAVTYSAETRRKFPSDPNNPTSELQSQSIEKDSKVLGRVIVKAREYQKQEQQQYETALDNKIKARQDAIREAKRLIAIDKKAMEARLKSLNDLLVKTQKVREGIEKEAVALRTKTLDKERESARRKQEIDRLRNQVEELIADQYRLEQQKSKIENLLVRLRAINERLDRRLKVLLSQGAGSGNSASTQPKTD